MLRSLPIVLLTAFVAAQGVSLPTVPQTRYVDWSQTLDHPGAVVVVGKLGKWKEGKRERLADGQLGGGNAVSQVSGTQYFVVPVTTTIAPRTFLHGKADKLPLLFDVQLARLPDGKEQRQARTGNGARLDEDQLALFVVVPKPKAKGFELRHVIPFDPQVDKGPDGELQFADAMRDFAAVNRRVHELNAAIGAVDEAKDPAGKKLALTTLRERLDQKVELKQPANDALLTQHAGPLEQRARQRLDEAAKEAEKAAKDK